MNWSGCVHEYGHCDCACDECAQDYHCKKGGLAPDPHLFAREAELFAAARAVKLDIDGASMQDYPAFARLRSAVDAYNTPLPFGGGIVPAPDAKENDVAALVRHLCTDLRCHECGKMMTNHVVLTRHETGPCDESFTGPPLPVYLTETGWLKPPRDNAFYSEHVLGIAPDGSPTPDLLRPELRESSDAKWLVVLDREDGSGVCHSFPTRKTAEDFLLIYPGRVLGLYVQKGST